MGVATEKNKMEGLRGDPVLGKYEKILRMTHAPIERIIKNMQDDGVPEDEVRASRLPSMAVMHLRPLLRLH